MLEHGPAGVILSPAEGSDPTRIRELTAGRTSVLVFNRELGPDWDFLAMDNQRGAAAATEHLIARGHRRIAFFGGHRASSSCRQRRDGYRDAMLAAGLEPQPRWLIECPPTRLEAARQVNALFSHDPAPTAAVCYNDAVALGLMAALPTCGRRAGHDFALTGFDDIPEASISSPTLTTIAADPRGRGRQAAKLVLQRSRDPEQPPRRIVAEVRLSVRGSSDAQGLSLEARA
jgi:LacI family transcriptional regulator